ncbi:Gfo/Idh/MocA family oxidoreductase [Roseomonas sp. SSH11]|uniref:Gfo/Idh/MocA family oxidoreductase n=1 Tax=Pararoseomonas baculiformis TaxID=2820812 RepID=A0ABS4AHF8_9PROT|nr:Gfo/Idh/MocA family oxidoreductase [Pararoseomonas baculiformis]MBP0446435.1 Gfo/Idh/MocA family oxidoreductase [Pararoseomonas baculiformis]
MRRLRLGILGAGHFGRFHALKAARGPRFDFVGLHDANPERAALVAGEAGCPALPAEAVIERAEAVIVAAPTAFHHGLAHAALSAGRHVLVEKPIAATLDEADNLISLARAKGVVLQVGQLERFSGGMRALRGPGAVDGGLAARVGRPLYMEAIRIAPFRPRSLDVSVVLDLMIHDLDLALALAGSPLVGVDAVGSRVVSPTIDIANARLRFGNGAVATITASRVSLQMERRLRVFGDAGYLNLDHLKREMFWVRRGEGEALEQVPGHGLSRATWAESDSLEAEHASFAAACLDGTPVEADGVAGRAALDAALRVEAAVRASLEAAAAG